MFHRWHLDWGLSNYAGKASLIHPPQVQWPSNCVCVCACIFPHRCLYMLTLPPHPADTSYLFMLMFKLSVVICHNGKWFVLQIRWFSLRSEHTFFFAVCFLFFLHLVVLRLIEIPAVLWLATATKRSKIISYSGRHVNYRRADPVSWFSQKWQGQIVSKCHFNSDFHQSTESSVGEWGNGMWPHVSCLRWHVANKSELFL